MQGNRFGWTRLVAVLAVLIGLTTVGFQSVASAALRPASPQVAQGAEEFDTGTSTGTDPVSSSPAGTPVTSDPGPQADTAPPDYATNGNCSGLGLWCGKFKNNIALGIGLVHDWTGTIHYSGILKQGQYSNKAPSCCYWKDTDGFYVGYPYAVRVQTGGQYTWHYWWGCTTVNGYCKVGYFKKGDLYGSTNYYYFVAAAKVY